MAFDAGIQDANQFLAQLSAIGGTQVPIEFKYQTSGAGPGGEPIPMAAKGLTVEPRPGGRLLIAGEAGQTEHVLPQPDLNKLLQGAMARGAAMARRAGSAFAAGGDLNVKVNIGRKQLASATIHAHRTNRDGQRTRFGRGGR